MSNKLIDYIRAGHKEKFYSSRTWKKFRVKVLERDHYECQWCRNDKTKPRIVTATVVHHIKEVNDYPDLAFDMNNCVSLCRECHERHHGRDKFKPREAQKKFWNEERW